MVAAQVARKYRDQRDPLPSAVILEAFFRAPDWDPSVVEDLKGALRAAGVSWREFRFGLVCTGRREDLMRALGEPSFEAPDGSILTVPERFRAAFAEMNLTACRPDDP